MIIKSRYSCAKHLIMKGK